MSDTNKTKKNLPIQRPSNTGLAQKPLERKTSLIKNDQSRKPGAQIRGGIVEGKDGGGGHKKK